MGGVEPLSQAWEARVIAVIRHPQKNFQDYITQNKFLSITKNQLIVKTILIQSFKFLFYLRHKNKRLICSSFRVYQTLNSQRREGNLLDCLQFFQVKSSRVTINQNIFKTLLTKNKNKPLQQEKTHKNHNPKLNSFTMQNCTVTHSKTVQFRTPKLYSFGVVHQLMYYHNTR